MFKVGDLYPNFGNVTTRGKTLVDTDEASKMHVSVPAPQAKNIWVVLAVLAGIVFLLGAVQR